MEKIVTDTTKSSLTNFAGTKTLTALAYPADTTVTVTSFQLLEIVNQERAKAGESQVRHNDFLNRCKDELDGEVYETFVHPPEGYRPAAESIRMTQDQCKLVAMRESKSVRRHVLARLKELEAKTAQTQPQVALPHDYISALEHLLESKKAEQLAIAQRDEAIRTKAQIGSTREATAMATAASAKKEAEALKARLGESVKSATVKAVESLTKSKFKWKPLKDWCDKNAAPIGKVLDEQYGSVNSYPAEAWQAVHDIHLKTLFSKAFA